MFVVELLRRYQKYVAKKNGIESDSDTEDGGALSRRGSMIPLSLSSMWRTSRKKSMASNWIPADPVELVVFPPELLVTHTAIVPTGRRSRGRHPVFAIFKARQYNRDDNDEALHHVILTLESDGNLVSIYRSNSYQETFDLYQSCVACDQLFYLLDSSKEEASTAIPRLLNQLIKHPLWRAGHIAAALGLVSYFERMRKQRQLGVIHEPCRPEKYYPHMIAIENNNIELATMLATMGADLSETDANGNNAMHFAALASPEMLEALWAFEPTHDLINKQNNDGYAPLLYSIRHANARCTAKLAGYGAQLKLQFEGVSNPLFTAMQSSSNSVDVIRALLDSSPELIDETDPQTGNRAIHAAFSKKPLTALLILKGSTIDVNARNTLGQTALHVYAFKGDLGCVMSLASNNADLNAVDANGDTALHIAVCHANLLIVRALLCLGADVNIKNHVGDSPRHLAAKFIGQEREDLLHSLKICGAYRCSEWRIECREGCASKHINPQMSVISKKSTAESVDSLVDFIVDSTVNNAVDYTDEGIDAGDLKAAAVEERLDAMPATREAKVHDTMQNLCYQNSLADLKDEKKKERMINLLSLDGGGIRGLVIIQLLMAIEEALHDNVFDYFDWVAGTSTGSILALALAEGKTLREIQHLYLRFKDYIFDTWSRPYNTSALEAFMQVELGADTTLADVKHPRLLVTTVEGDVIPVKLKLLRNYDMPLSEKDKKDMGYEKPEDWTVWKALRCSSAAPTFFCSVDGKFIDGGLISNNPLCELLSEIHLYNTACKLNQGAEEPVRIGCVLSLGTGIAASRPSESVDMTGAFSNLVANVLAIKSLGIILIDQVTATEGAPVDRSRSWCHSLGVPLFRMSAPLTNDVQMDEKGDAEIVQLLWDCLEYTQRHRDDIAELVALLRLSGKSEHRRKLFTDSEISAEAFAEASSEASAEAFAEASAEAFAEASAEASPEVSSKPSPEVSSKPSLEVSWNLSPEVSPEPSSEASPKLFSEVSRRK